MHTNQWRVAVTLPLALLSGTALAETPSVDLGGLLYAHYGYLLDEEAHGYNEFDIDRVYLTARSKLGKGFSARVTTDMGRTGSEDDTRIRTYLKYAYLETKLNDEFNSSARRCQIMKKVSAFRTNGWAYLELH